MEASVRTGFGGGYKAGFFPSFTHRIVGLEAEAFGVGAAMTAPRASREGTVNSVQTNLIALNTLVNLLIRYPGDRWQPYVGIGGGMSSGYFRDTDIRHGIGRITGYASDLTYAYQFLGGLRGYVDRKVYVFAEYKYFLANYQWSSTSASGQPATMLHFHTHLCIAGIGLSF